LYWKLFKALQKSNRIRKKNFLKLHFRSYN
jgi:hypothetical protein